MSRYRKIHVKMWTSPDFLALSAPKPNAQTLFVYLLTGPHTTAIPGLFQAGKAQLAEALGWPQRALDRCWSEIEARDMARADWTARLVYLPGALAHNAPRNPNEVRSWREHWALLPKGPLLSRAEAAFASFLAPLGPSFADAWASVLGNVPPNVQVNVTPNVTPNVPSESGERYPERSAEQYPERSTRTRTHAGATPAPAPVRLDPEGVQGEGQPGPVEAMLLAHPELRPIARAAHADEAMRYIQQGLSLERVAAAVERLASEARAADRSGSPWSEEPMARRWGAVLGWAYKDRHRPLDGARRPADAGPPSAASALSRAPFTVGRRPPPPEVKTP